MSIFITIISGTFVFVIGQTFLKLFIEPWQLHRECIARIANRLLFYDNVFSNPGIHAEEKMREASVETRELASDLSACCYRIPLYEFLSRVKVFPTMKIIFEVQKNLIGLSNSTHSGKAGHNAARSDKIKSLFKIQIYE